MKWLAGVAVLALALLWFASPGRQGWDWAGNWAGQIGQPAKPKLVPIEPPPPPATAPAPAAPAPVLVPKPRPKAPTIQEPKQQQPRAKPAAKGPAKPAQIQASDCRQIGVGINLIGPESMRREARARGYTDKQIAAAERACGF